MELIKFKKDGGLVTVEIEIGGTVTWRYRYRADDFNVTRTHKDSEPYLHAIGLPHELQFDFNAWDVQLANMGDQPQDYEVTLTWTQDDRELGCWNRSGTLTAAEPAKVESGNATLIGE